MAAPSRASRCLVSFSSSAAKNSMAVSRKILLPGGVIDEVNWIKITEVFHGGVNGVAAEEK